MTPRNPREHDELYTMIGPGGRKVTVRCVFTRRADGYWECRAGRHETRGELLNHARAKMRALLEKEGP